MTLRVFILAALLGASATLLAAACGGRVLGSLDDAGVFRAPDGGVIFGPGSACVGYDAAAFIAASSRSPVCTDTLQEPSPQCIAWALDAGVSFGYRPYVYCEGINVDAGGPTCVLSGWFSNDEPLAHCEPGPEGDAYCQAFAQQFLLRGRAAPYICDPDPNFGHFCIVDGQKCNYVKYGVGSVLPDGATTPGDGFIYLVSVQDDDGGYRCEPICLPP